MTFVPLTCPRCAGLIPVSLADAGRQIACPACQGLIAVPPPELLAPPVPPPMAEPPVAEPPVIPTHVEPPPVELLPLTCPACGGLFQVATTLAGSRVACPNCRALVMAAAAMPQIEPPIAPPPIAQPPARPELATPAPADGALLAPSPKDRARRRHARNLILWLVCLLILLAALWLLR